MDVRLVIKQRLEELGLEQRDLAKAAHVTESYISQLLTQKKSPPAADRTGLYERMNSFLKLPKGQLSAMVQAQRTEELKRKLTDAPAPLFKEVRDLIVRKCKREKQNQVRAVFEKQAFGELERLVTQKLLDVTKRIARDELKNEERLKSLAGLRNCPYEVMRGIVQQFLTADILSISPEQCDMFLQPLIDSWDIDLKTFAMDIVLNQRVTSMQFTKFQFVELGDAPDPQGEPGFQEFVANGAMSGDATEEELAFLRRVRFVGRRPSALYYYRELQSIRDPLHFRGATPYPSQRRGDSSNTKKSKQLESRKDAIRRWAANTRNSRKKE